MVDIGAHLTRRLGGNQTLTINILLEYFDVIERLVIRDCSLGGMGRDLIIQGELESF